MLLEKAPNRAYVIRAIAAAAGVEATAGAPINWATPGEVVGVSVSIDPIAGVSQDFDLPLVGLWISDQTAKNSLGTDGQADQAVPFAHLVGPGQVVSPWSRKFERSDVWNVRILNRSAVAHVICVTLWVIEYRACDKSG
jgi:hypothetical protein